MRLSIKLQTTFFLIAVALVLVGMFCFLIIKGIEIKSKNQEVPIENYPDLNYLNEKVLGENTASQGTVSFNISAVFNEDVLIKKDLEISGGKITASNIIYQIMAGSGIEVSGNQQPKIDNTGVLSLNEETGNLTLSAGGGISLEGLKISNADPGSSQNIFKNIKIDKTGFSASSNNDTLTFLPGDGIALELDSSNKITIANTGKGSDYTAGNGLFLSEKIFTIAAPACLDSDKLVWDGKSFVCSPDKDTDTNNYPTTLTVSGNSLKTITLSRNGLADLTAELVDIDIDTTYIAGAGLNLNSTTFDINAPTCTGTDKLAWNGSSFNCLADIDTNTIYTAGSGLTLNDTVFKLGGSLEEDIGLYGAGNLGIGTSNPIEKLDINGNLKIFDENLQRGDIYTVTSLDKTWSTDADFNTAGTSFSPELKSPADNNELKLNYYVQNPLLPEWQYRKEIHLNNNNTGILTNHQVTITINTQSLISSGKLQENCNDLRFADSDNSLLNYWVESGCNTETTKVWIKIPSLTVGAYTVYFYYGNPFANSNQNPEAVFDFFDNFDSFNSARWKATATYSISNSEITVPYGAVYSRNTVSSQPGAITEAKLKWTSVSPHPCSFSIANTQSTQTNNAGSSKLTYWTLSKNDVYAYGADGTSPSYNTVPAIAQFVASANTSYILGYAITDSQFIYYKDRIQTSAYTGTWSAPFYVWFGYFMGAGAGYTTISPVVVDWVLVRKYAAFEPNVISFGEETTNYYASGVQTWLSETLDAGNTGSFQPNKFMARWELDGSDNIVPQFQLLASNTGQFDGEETVFPAFDLVNNIEKEIYNEVSQSFRYWKVKVFLETGQNKIDTPRVYSFRLREYRPSISLSATAQRVGIGNYNPAHKLDVNDNQASAATAMISNSDTGQEASVLSLKIGNTSPSNTNSFLTFLNGNGEIVGKVTGNGSGGVTYSTTGSDFAEYFKKADVNETLEPGDVVCLNALGLVTKCDSVNTQVVGVISSSAGFTGNSNHANDPQYVLVGILGQLDVKVSTESGTINPGDSLTASTTPGIAVKNSNSGNVIGKVLSSCDSYSISYSYCPAFVHVSYEQVMANTLINSLAVTSPSSDLDPLSLSLSLSKLTVSGLSNLSDVSITGKLTAGLISVNGLESSITALGTLKFQNETVLVDLNGNINTQGEITAQKINIAGASIGEGVIPAGQTQVIIKTPAITKNSKIFVTPTTETSIPLAVIEKNERISFVIRIRESVSYDIKFDWWIIN